MKSVLLAFLLLLTLPAQAADGFLALGYVNAYYNTGKGDIAQVVLLWHNPDAPYGSRSVVYRDGVLQSTSTKNYLGLTGEMYYQYVAGDATYTYVVCTIGTGECSVPVTVVVD